MKALLEEICSVGKAVRLCDEKNGEAHEVVSVFVGGGTPSILLPEWMKKIFKCLEENFCFAENPEISIEANPGTVSLEKLKIYRECGINRISFGLQSAENEQLKRLGRIHTFEIFLESFRQAREAGFQNINVDLMFDLPGQTRESWEKTLRTAAALHPEHISAYSLILEEGTPFGENPPELPDEDTEYFMYEDTAAVLSEYGYEQYEISNYAREGFACRHNIGYWQGTEYLGLGLGASSLFEEMRFFNSKDMDEYLSHSKEPDRIRKEKEMLTEENQMEEFMFLGLRMTRGVSEKEFQRRFGVSLEEIYGDVLSKYRKLGLMEEAHGFWRFSRKGIHVSNPILADFLFDEES